MLTPERWRQIEQLYQAAQKPTYSAHHERMAENEWTATCFKSELWPRTVARRVWRDPSRSRYARIFRAPQNGCSARPEWGRVPTVNGSKAENKLPNDRAKWPFEKLLAQVLEEH